MARKGKEIRWVSEGDCWRCTSHALRGGYPVARRNGATKSIARLIVIRRLGEIPTDIVSRHTCDHRWCIRPDHIIHGSQKDNAADRESQSGWRDRSRERNGNAKLTTAQVNEIRSLALSGRKLQKEIAAQFGIKRAYVAQIKSGKTWASA